ncbi:MAG TPA: DUF302 domain-containing protein [Virgibacillus sp.]|nr:DUF302 domain-containing protein [Virgibacillus sp.]HLR66948.1 DUF302 domain-containing protein [Virgibacillus sp.]
MKFAEIRTEAVKHFIDAIKFRSYRGAMLMENKGLQTSQSKYSMNETVRHFEDILAHNEATLFAKIDHSHNAAQAGLKLRNTIVFIFGAPHIGTLLMQENQQIAIDLPSKVLIWEDEDDTVWVTRNRTSWLTARHEMKGTIASEKLEKKIHKMVQEITVSNK